MLEVTDRYTQASGKKRILMALLFGVVVLLLGMSYQISNNDTLSPEEWTQVHQLRKQAECRECHSGHDYVEEGFQLSGAGFIPPARSHTPIFRKMSHGRQTQTGKEGCYACHELSTCVACHHRPPADHTSDFTAPTGDTLGMLRHIIQGRTAPSSCLVCHNDFTADCGVCHVPSQLHSWREEGAKRLIQRWPELISTSFDGQKSP